MKNRYQIALVRNLILITGIAFLYFMIWCVLFGKNDKFHPHYDSLTLDLGIKEIFYQISYHAASIAGWAFLLIFPISIIMNCLICKRYSNGKYLEKLCVFAFLGIFLTPAFFILGIVSASNNYDIVAAIFYCLTIASGIGSIICWGYVSKVIWVFEKTGKEITADKFATREGMCHQKNAPD